MKVTINVTMDPALIAKLKSLSQAGEGPVMRKALYAGGLVIEGNAKRNVVQKDIVDTGFLLNSVYTATQEQSGYSGISEPAERAGMLLSEERPGPKEAIVSVGAEYAIYHEMGTAGMAARPFMRPAVDESPQQIAEAIAGVLKRELGG